METSLADAKSCDPQRFDGDPQQNWNLDELGVYAREQHEAIVRSESSLTTHYWRLGLALSFCRRHFSRGQWGPYLADLGIDKTRASKACAIHRTFKSEQAVNGLSVEKAYGHRERKVRKSSHKKRRKKRPLSLTDWLHEICKATDHFLDEAAFVAPADAGSIVPALDTAIEDLTSLRERLQQRTSDS
ncbi:MAG: hypothetical protein DWQ35_20110 [Planctomycetota bacterium]|nr:MAG: hypothetical protein DWQ35_20110 [Planctomycetota bacterium]REK28373.1 MAG: hypothetical protein DWQ42_05190 [Planctomycetota bacterium]REK48389.1 MAG: hypothetical protein DWQ46_02340 [Planctomycetota bacterium]